MMVITFVVMAGAILASTAYTVYKFDRMRRLAREIELQVEASYAEAKMRPKDGNMIVESQFLPRFVSEQRGVFFSSFIPQTWSLNIVTVPIIRFYHTSSSQKIVVSLTHLTTRTTGSED